MMKRPWMLFELLQTTSKGFGNLFVIFGKIEGFIAIFRKIWGQDVILQKNWGQNMNMENLWTKTRFREIQDKTHDFRNFWDYERPRITGTKT